MLNQKLFFNLGEKRHAKVEVRNTNGEDVPFTINNATFQLYKNGELEDSGDCTVKEHQLDAFIEPEKTGLYKLKYTYEILDERLIDVVEIQVEP